MRQLKTDWRIVFIYLFLLIIGVPWYWPDNNSLLILGLPAWVFIAIIISLVISVLTAWILLIHQWPGEEESTGSDQDE